MTVVGLGTRDPTELLRQLRKDALNGQTGFVYDALGQLIESSDPEGYVSTYQYDMLGQVTQRSHPDAGTTRYYYDNAGNMTAMQTQNLISGNDTVKYEYDLGKLMQITYPNNPEMNVYYEYGQPNTGNQSGRLVKMQDGTGVQTFEYGRMGEMTANTRTYVMPGGVNTYTFKMLWQYDSWNRVTQITYPDGEKVSYSYNQGGDLRQVRCAKVMIYTNIITSIGYDKFGSRTIIQYGNGTQAQYTYDAQSRRLSNLSSQNNTSEAMQNISYTYDNVGNITQTANSAAAMINGLGGAYTYNYTYDDIYRLTNSNGSWGLNASYTLSMSYSASGRILSKNQTANKSINGSTLGVPTDFTYTYTSNNQPHAVRSVGTGSSMEYDENGNMTYYHNPTIFGVIARHQAWDEENRLGAVGDDSYLSSYVYEAGGDRVLKMSGSRQQMLIGEEPYLIFANMNENKTLYVGAFMVVKNNGYTKHYYIEGERVSSKIGGGFLYAPVVYTQAVTPLLHGASYAELGQRMLNHLQRDAQAVGYDSTQTSFPTLFRCISTMANSNASETEKFYYHPDHLGSSSMISDKNGKASQHLQYLPYGESFVEQKTTATYYTPYRFSGKEKDEETQYSYFGARYYDSDLSVWLSVDPMADLYPSLSPYSYAANSPIIITDPNGMTLDVALNEESKNDITTLANKENRSRIIIDETTGSVSLNFSDLSDEDKAALLDSDEGLALINEIVESDKKFYYEAGDVAFVCGEGGWKATPYINEVGSFNGVVNASNYGKDSNGANTHRPQEGYDGQVAVAIHGKWIDSDGANNRKSLIFHELAENYYKTHFGYDYYGNESNGGVGSHQRAATREGSRYGNPTPGSFQKYIALPVPPAVMKEIKIKINMYYGY